MYGIRAVSAPYVSPAHRAGYRMFSQMERCKCDRIPQTIRLAARKVADLSMYKRHLYIGQTPPVQGTDADL